MGRRNSIATMTSRIQILCAVLQSRGPPFGSQPPSALPGFAQDKAASFAGV